MTDYHVPQLDGSACASRNCAACSGAMGLYWQTGEKLTGAQFRAEAGVSCVPGAHTGTGGLYISDVQRVFRAHGATIDYGEIGDPPTNYTRWPPSDLPRRLQAGEGAVLLGDYDALPMQYRASKTFLGDHSVWVHDYRIVAGDDQTHWHDPLRKVGMWIPINAVISYWWKPTSPIRGFAGWVTLQQQGADMYNTKPAATIGTTTFNGAGHYLMSTTDPKGTRYGPRAAGEALSVVASVNLVDAKGTPIDIDGNQPPKSGRDQVYLVDAPSFGASAFALRADCTPVVVSDTASFNAGVDAAAKAAASAHK